MLAVFNPSAVAAAAPEADAPLADALPPAAALLVGVLLDGALVDELLDELHAASAAIPAAAAGITSIARRRRFGTVRLCCEVVMSFPPFRRTQTNSSNAVTSEPVRGC
jgi:hypothetical protein